MCLAGPIAALQEAHPAAGSFSPTPFEIRKASRPDLQRGPAPADRYDADPEKNKDAVLYENITFGEALNKNLKVMDMTAFALCRENNIPIIVLNMNKPDNFKDLVLGKKVGTFVHN